MDRVLSDIKMNIRFSGFLRYGIVFLAVTVPGIYLAAVMHHTHMLPSALVDSMSKARTGIPYSGFMELLLMSLVFELALEAGRGISDSGGAMIGIIGGFAAGYAACAAHLAAPAAVWTAGVAALCAGCIPNRKISGTLRLLKYGMILAGFILGILGIMFGWLLILAHLAGLESFDISCINHQREGE